MIRPTWLALLVCLAAAAPASSQAGGPALGGVSLADFLKHAAIARQIVDYEGTKILSVLRGDLMETITLNEAHKRPDRTRLDFLSPEGVAGRILIDDGRRTWHYEPRLHMAFVGPTLAGPADAVAAVPINRYRAALLGREEVIGRPTIVVSLWPAAGKRERRMWIDRYMGVTLRAEERDPDEGLVSTSYFTRIRFGLNVPEALFTPRAPAGVRVVDQAGPTGPLETLPALRRVVGFDVPAPQVLPEGFRFVGGQPVRDGPVVAAHLHYTDGVRALALFVAPARRLGPPGRGQPVPALGSDARTLVVGALRLLLWESKGNRLTLVGPLSLRELVTVAGAVSTASP